MPSSILNSDDGVISGTSGLKNSGGDDGVLVFQSKGTETARITTDNYLRLASGGIQFNGDTAAANALDDYEEGTWTPVLTSQGGTLTSYVATYGTYVKIGRKVLAECKIDSIVVGTATGGGFIAGWPFTAANTTTGAAASDNTGTAQAFTLGTGGSGVVSKFDGTTPFAGSQNIIVQVNYDI
jgi:hypothetical protein